MAIGVTVAAFLIYKFRTDGPAALDAWRAAHIQWSWVALSIVCGLAGHACFVYGWKRLLADARIDAPWWQLVRMFLVSNLGRYMPGQKAWQMGIIGMMAAEQNLAAGALATSSLFQGMVGVGVGAIVLLAAGGETLGIARAWLVLPVGGAIMLLFLPHIVRSIPRLHALIERFVPGIGSVTAATMWALIWTSFTSWILWGLALLCLGHALSLGSTASVIGYITAWAASFLAGILAIVAPAGLGVREAAMRAALVAAGMQSPDILVLLIVQRMWITLFDVVPAVAVLAMRRRAAKRVGPA